MATPLQNSVQANLIDLTGLWTVDGLLFGTKWGPKTPYTPVTLTYSFPQSGSWWSTTYYDNPDSEPFSPKFRQLSVEQSQAVNSSLYQWSAVSGVSFVQVIDGRDEVGELRFAWWGGGPPYDYSGLQAHAYFPSSYTSGGDVWLNADQNWDAFEPGSHGYFTLLHEIGHALGLKHSFEESEYSIYTIKTDYDHYKYTIMSYSAFISNTKSYVNFYPTTPMLLDIQAIQYLYDYRYINNGDNVYIFNEGNNYFQTIYDTGGRDTFVWNGVAEGCTIDLRPGNFSDLGNTLIYFDDNGNIIAEDSQTVATYFTTIIENAIGGDAHDILIGNTAYNSLDGGRGDDKLYGGEGNDKLFGGSGSDQSYGEAGDDKLFIDAGDDALDGGSGSDWLLVTGRKNSTVVLAQATAQDTGYGTDTISSIENASGGSGVDQFYGTGGANILKGNDGNDFLFGKGGNDTLKGGNGEDFLGGGGGRDLLQGGRDNDTMFGEAGADKLVGNGGKDLIYAGVDSDVDVIAYKNQNDSQAGAANRDHIYDFVSGTDKISLAALDANTSLSGNQAFAFSASGPAANSIWIEDIGTDLLIRADMDGDRMADFEIQVIDIATLAQSDFVL